MRFFLAASVACGVLGACSFVSKLDDLRGDGGGLDGALADAAPDTEPDAPGDAARFCANQPDGSFCDDFDNGGKRSEWKVPPDASVDFIVDSTNAFSKPFSLSGVCAGQSPSGGLVFAPPLAKATKVTVSGEVWVAKECATTQPLFFHSIGGFIGGVSTILLLGIAVQNNATVGVLVYATFGADAGTTAINTTYSPIAFPLDRWAEVTFGVDLAQPAVASAVVDGANVVTFVLPVAQSALLPTSFVGMQGISPLAQCTIRHDNVVVRAQ